MSQSRALGRIPTSLAFIAILAAGGLQIEAQQDPTLGRWVELGGSASPGGISGSYSGLPRLVLDGAGYPGVAWHVDIPIYGHQTYLRRWNGSAWVELAGSASGGGVSNGAGYAGTHGLAVDGSGNPVVVWSDRSDPTSNFTRVIYLRRFNGTAWVELGGSATGGGISNQFGSWSAGQSIAVAVDGAGNPVVAWSHRDDATVIWRVYLRRWNGSDWEELDRSGTDGIGICNPGSLGTRVLDLAVDTTGNPIVAWQYNDAALGSGILLRRWNGSAWVGLGGSASGNGASSGSPNSFTPVLAVDDAGNPVLAWVSTLGYMDNEIYLRRWNGSAWVEVGGSATGGGISNASSLVGRPSLALDANGNPVVSWEDLSSGVWQIYLKRWTGSAWIELDASATDPGVSQDPMTCILSSVGVNAAGRPFVAWTHHPNGGPVDVRLRRWIPMGLQDLSQHRNADAEVIPTGSWIPQGKIRIRGRAMGGSAGALLQMQVEANPIGQSFTGIPTATSSFASPGQWSDIWIWATISGAWHWQARAVDSTGLTSAWQPFGANSEGTPDFLVEFPALPPLPEPSGGGSSGGCGLLGWEAILLLPFLRMLQRSFRRTPRRAGA